VNALACLDAAVDEAERVLGLDDLRDDRGELELVEEYTGEVIDVVPAPIAVVSGPPASAGLPDGQVYRWYV
jgi:putative transposase